jgi:hypothetical protein
MVVVVFLQHGVFLEWLERMSETHQTVCALLRQAARNPGEMGVSRISGGPR